jgi:hypothetical protein
MLSMWFSYTRCGHSHENIAGQQRHGICWCGYVLALGGNIRRVTRNVIGTKGVLPVVVDVAAFPLDSALQLGHGWVNRHPPGQYGPDAFAPGALGLPPSPPQNQRGQAAQDEDSQRRQHLPHPTFP